MHEGLGISDKEVTVWTVRKVKKNIQINKGQIGQNSWVWKFEWKSPKTRNQNLAIGRIPSILMERIILFQKESWSIKTSIHKNKTKI
jgi:hypothetical protein